ncbi:MAG: hypothetical protein ABSA43_01650 [Candidatus Microgenomates bacterium]
MTEKTHRVVHLLPIVILVLAVPLFVWGVIKFNLDIRNRAASNESVPTPIPNLIFGDDFSTNKGWEIVAGSSTSASLVNETYHLRETKTSTFQYSLAPPATLANYNLQVDAKLVGSDPKAGLGVLFDVKCTSPCSSLNSKDFYRFYIYPQSGTWKLDKSYGSDWSTLKSGTITQIPLKLKVERNTTLSGIKIYYSTGGDWQLILSKSDGDIKNGRVGLLVVSSSQTSATKTAEAEFDNFMVSSIPTATASPTSTASATPTATASSSPTATPTQTPTSTASPTPTGQKQSMEFWINFGGVTGGNADGAKILLRFKSNDGTIDQQITTPLVTHWSDVNNAYIATLELTSNFLPSGKTYTVYVKGEKHLSTKFCTETGQNTRCTTNGTITFPAPLANALTKIYSFANYPLPPGDLPPQDGVANTNDYQKIQALMGTSCDTQTATDLYTADLNYDGCVNIKDALLMRQTLETRYDEN